MRLWSLHPEYLDPKGLVALWREALLAQKVLKGETKGYRYHPQLERFKSTKYPVAAIATYLSAVHKEAEKRGYSFDESKIESERILSKIPVSTGQVLYEREHLIAKLFKRDNEKFKRLKMTDNPGIHPLFIQVNGDVENWEKKYKLLK